MAYVFFVYAFLKMKITINNEESSVIVEIKCVSKTQLCIIYTLLKILKSSLKSSVILEMKCFFSMNHVFYVYALEKNA